VDTGGTFTDVVVSGGNRGLVVGKALTTPARAFDGLSASIADAAGQMGLSLVDLLAATSMFIYGTTRATNAIVTKQGAKTAFLTTDGFQDTLVLKEGGKTNPHDFSMRFPDPYVPRRRTFSISERMTSEGTVHDALDEDQARDDILVSTSVGGCMQVRELIERPIHTARSGPAMAPVAARAFSAIEGLGGDIIVCDTGSTTFDVGLVVGG